MIRQPSEAWWCLAVPFILMVAVLIGSAVIDRL